MDTFELTADEWTQIVSDANRADVLVRPTAGTILVSLEEPRDAFAVTLAADRAAMTGTAFARREVSPGLPVFARAVEGAATVTVAPVTR